MKNQSLFGRCSKLVSLTIGKVTTPNCNMSIKPTYAIFLLKCGAFAYETLELILDTSIHTESKKCFLRDFGFFLNSKKAK